MDKTRLYFMKQKAIGVLLLIATILAIIVLKGDITIGFITVPMALTLIFTKEKVWMDNYYFDDVDESDEL